MGEMAEHTFTEWAATDEPMFTCGDKVASRAFRGGLWNQPHLWRCAYCGKIINPQPEAK